MYHPWRKDRYGKPLIQLIHPETVKKGKAEQMGYTKVIEPVAPPDFDLTKQPRVRKGGDNATS